MIGCDQEAEHIEHVMLAQMLLVDAQHIGRRCRVSLEVVIECEAIGLAEVSDLAYAQDDGL